MKYVLVLIIALFSSTIYGQSNGYDIDRAVNKLAKLYNLNDAQKGQLKPILETKLKAYNSMLDGKGNFKKNIDHVKIQEADNTYNKSVLAILDEEQKKAFLNHQKISKGLLENGIIKSEDVKSFSGKKPQSTNQ